MRWNKIPDDVLWKEEIGKSGYTAYFVASCKKQGEQFYSRTDLLIFWHNYKTSVNVARRENRVTCVVLFMQSTYIISEVLRIGICLDDALTLDYRMHQSAGCSWSWLYTILKWQLLTSSVRREIWSFWIFCCKNTTYVVLFMRSTYIISEFTHHRLVVVMGGR